MTEYLAPIKIVLKAIEYKFPGTCTDILKDLGRLNENPHYQQLRIREAKEKWEHFKDSFSASETKELAEKSGLDLGNPDNWDAIIGPTPIDGPEFNTPTDTSIDEVTTVVDVPDVDVPDVDPDDVGSIWDTIFELFR